MIKIADILKNSKQVKTLKFPEDNNSLLGIIQDSADLIHKNSLRSSGNIIIVHPNTTKILEKKLAKKLKLFLTEEEKADHLKNINIEIENSKLIGVLNNRFYIFETKDMTENEIIVALKDDGYSVETSEHFSCGMPELEIKYDEERAKLGNISYYGVIQIGK